MSQQNSIRTNSNAELFKRLYISQLDWHKKYPYLGLWEVCLMCLKLYCLKYIF